LERRSKSEASHAAGSVNQELTSNPPTSNLSHLPYIEETIARGGITIGTIRPVKECVAIAHEGKITLAMLSSAEKVNLWQNCSHVWITPLAWHTRKTSSRTRSTRNRPSSCHPSISRRPKANAYLLQAIRRSSLDDHENSEFQSRATAGES
jgi:hypothetical protein